MTEQRLYIWRCPECGALSPWEFVCTQHPGPGPKQREVATERIRVYVEETVRPLVEAVTNMPNTRDANIAGWWETAIKPLLATFNQELP